MLEKKKCIEAIINWEITRSKYSKIESLIPHASVFNFTKEHCAFIKEGNKSDKFHAYIGIYNDQLILIIVHLDAKGKEIVADSYVTSTLDSLKSELTLIETDVIITTTTLSTFLEIKNCSEQIKGSVYNKPTITEAASLLDIERWKNHYKDWFFSECNDFQGQRIFRAFTVPLADLNNGEAMAIFGFKDSLICQRPIPILIFIALDPTTKHAQIIRSSTTDPLSGTNTKDYSQPCPPMCRLEKNFDLLS